MRNQSCKSCKKANWPECTKKCKKFKKKNKKRKDGYHQEKLINDKHFRPEYAYEVIE